MTSYVSAEDFRYPPSHGIDMTAVRQYRLERVRQELRRRDMAAVLLFDPLNIRYATDTSNMQVWTLHNPARYAFVPADGPVVLFDFHNCEHISNGVGTVDEVRPGKPLFYFEAGERLSEQCKAFARETADLMHAHGGGSRRIGIDRLHHEAVAELQIQGLTVLDGQEPLEIARSIKSEEELKCMQAAVDTCEAAMDRMHKAVRPGMTEIELWSLMHQENIARGGEWIETRLLSSGARTNPWFQEASHRPIQAGELVSYDTDLIGPFGYCADISRAFLCGDGQPSAEQKARYQLAYEQIQYNMELLKPGMGFREFAEKSFQLSDDFIGNRYSVVAHGVGLCDEYPKIAYPEDYEKGGYDGVILPGMTLCVESYIGHRDGGEGVKLEEQVLITETGIRVLSRYPFETDWLVT